MIYRPQSLFLILILALELAVLLGLEIWSKGDLSGQLASIQLYALEHSKNGELLSTQWLWPSLLFLLLSFGLTPFILFSHRNRMRQMWMGLLNSALIAACMASLFFSIFKVGVPLFEPQVQGKYGLGFYALVIALLANMIANRLIRKDEMLVRSADRLR